MKVLLVFISIQLLYGIKADHFNPDVYLDVVSKTLACLLGFFGIFLCL